MAALPAPDRHGAQLRNVVKALAPRFQVDVMALKGADQAVVEHYLKARVLRVPAAGLTLAEQIDAFRRAVRRQLDGEDYEVIHFRDAWSGLPICERRQDLPSRLVFDVALSPQSEPRAADGELAATLFQSESYCFERADLILVPTETARRHLLRAGSSSRVAVVPPGVDVDHFDWEPPSLRRPRPVVLYAGRIAPGRRVRLLLEAVSLLLDQFDVEIWLCGPVDDALRKPLDDALAQFGLEGRLRELGAVDHDDMPRVIAQATVCVAPSAPDAQERPLASPPTKLLEYMACRRPVVAPDRPCVAEIIAKDEQGLLFRPGDAADLAACLRRLLGDPALAERLARAGYQRVRERHPATASRRALLEAYAHIVPADLHRPVALTPGAPIDVLPAHADTMTARREQWVAESAAAPPASPPPESDRAAPAPPSEAAPFDIEKVDFEAAGSMLPSQTDREKS